MSTKILTPMVEQQVRAVDRLFELFPGLAAEQDPQWREVLNRTQTYQYPANAMLASVGSTCNGFMILLDGTVRVFQHAEDGREVTLYRIGAGDICLMSLNSLIHHRPFRGNAISETGITILNFCEDDFHLAMKVSDGFRNLVLTHLVDSVCGMVHLFHDTAFESLETRLGALLMKLFNESSSCGLSVTHQALAQELGSSREVISRLLKKMEKNNCIVLKRGQIMPGKNNECLKAT